MKIKHYLLFFISSILISIPLHAQNYTIKTVAGGGIGSIATDDAIEAGGLAVDGAGDLYISSSTNNRILKLATGNIITSIAGNGDWGDYQGDNGPATAAGFNFGGFLGASPMGVIVDGKGDLYIVDGQNYRVRKVGTNGIITTIAGNGVAGFSGDNGAATLAELNNPTGIAIDGLSNIYIADAGNNRIRKINTAGVISTIAGGGTSVANGVAATTAELFNPESIAIDASGNIYIANTNDYNVRKIITGGIITTIAGNDSLGFSGDGGAATAAELFEPSCVTIDSKGDVYIADEANNRIRKVTTANGIITTVAGNGMTVFTGDNGAATAAAISNPDAIVVDGSGNLYIGDQGNGYIRKVSTSGIITSAAGNGMPAFSGDGGLATNAELCNPNGIATDASGNFYIADFVNQRIRKVNSGGIITTIAGNGLSSLLGGECNNCMATTTTLNYPYSVALDDTGNVYIADQMNNCIRKVNISGIITVYAAGLKGPVGVTFDDNDNLYIADQGNNCIRKVNTAGVMTVYAGNLTNGFSGDNGAATAAELSSPYGVAVDVTGNVYITDGGNYRIRKVSTGGIITTIAGNGIAGFSGDNGPATAAQFNSAIGVAADGAGNVYFADQEDNRVRRISANGIITTIGGNGIAGFSGDNGPATDAAVEDPWGMCLDKSGNIYVTVVGDERIRELTLVTGVNELSNTIGEVKIYPNPNKGVFTVSLQSVNSKAKIEVYNTIGEKVYESVLNANTTQVNLSANATGIYLYRVLTNENMLIGTGRFIVE